MLVTAYLEDSYLEVTTYYTIESTTTSLSFVGFAEFEPAPSQSDLAARRSSAQRERPIFRDLIVSSSLAASWTTTDDPTSGPMRLDLANKKGKLVVHAYGACDPAPCDWGSTAGTVYDSTPTANDGTAFTAQLDADGATTLLTGNLEDGDLVVSYFTKPDSETGLSNIFGVKVFQTRSSPPPSPPPQ